jgi:hypothetical protein
MSSIEISSPRTYLTVWAPSKSQTLAGAFTLLMIKDRLSAAHLTISLPKWYLRSHMIRELTSGV